MRPQPTLTVQFTVLEALDGLTPNEPIDVQSLAAAPTPSDQIYRRTVDRLGIFNPSLLSGEHGSIATRAVIAITVFGPASPGGSLDVVALYPDGTIRLQQTVGSLETTPFYSEIGALVPQGSALRLSGMSAAGDPIIVRVSLLRPKTFSDTAVLLSLHAA